jgi:class 3 adenylate cyclase/tetratricopeptide (TPR) repeat protein
MADKEVRKLAAVMFTDIQGYTALTQKDEDDALKKVAIHRKYLEEYTAEFHGRIIHFYGDGSLSIYDSALDAVRCAISMQLAYQKENPVPVRVGIHVGDIVFRDETVFGDGVNIASRIQTAGTPGSVLISDRVKAELFNHPEIITKSIGRQNLKNVSTPIEVFVVANPGLVVPTGLKKMPQMQKRLRYLSYVLLAVTIWWLVQYPLRKYFHKDVFTDESISVPFFDNHTGDPNLDHVSQMASHWITKELSVSSNAHVVSYETGSEMIQMAGLGIDTKPGRKKYQALTGAVNVVEGFYTKFGAHADSLLMSAIITNLESGLKVLSFKDVTCSEANPLECVKSMSDQIKGYWISRGDHVLTPPTYEAYKAFLAARKAWRSNDNTYVREQLDKAIALDPTFIDPYFLLLDYFFNTHDPEDASDTLQVMGRHFTDLDERQQNMIHYHTADIEGHNEDTYSFFMNEYKIDPKDLFVNNSAMVLAMMYRHDPRQAIRFYNDIPFDSLHVEGCNYCADRLELAMWAALDLDSMSFADIIAQKLNNALYMRQGYGAMIQYHVWKNDTTAINQLLTDAEHHTNLDRNWQYLYYLTGRLYLLRGHQDMASIYAKKSIVVQQSRDLRMLGRSYYLDKQYDKAKTIYLDARRKSPKDAQIAAELGMVYARQGNAGEAGKIIGELENLRANFDYGSVEYYQGRIYAILGDLDRATNLMATAIDKGKKYEIWVTFHHDPDLENLKDYPAYVRLINSQHD